MSSTYREYRPSPALAPFVECYWSRASLAAGGAPPAHSVLPDGCMDLVFNFGAAWIRSDKKSAAQPVGFRGGAVVGTINVYDMPRGMSGSIELKGTPICQSSASAAL